MDFSWKKFRLPRPWSNARDKRDRESVVDSPEQDRSYNQSKSDLLNESQHDGDNHERSSTNALDFLKLMSEQLMSAWAQEYPEWQEDIDAAGVNVLALADKISRQRQEHVHRHDDRVKAGIDACSEEITGIAGASLFPDTQVNGDGRTGLSLNEGGGATFSIHAPSSDKTPVQIVGKSSPSTMTSTIITTSIGHPLMSSEPYTSHVSGRGMHMEEETSLHGRIWVPSFHSIPDEHRQVPYGSSTKVRWSDDSCSQSWRLVSDDRPHSRGNRDRYTDEQDWRSVPDTTDAHNQQSSTSQGTGRLYDANFAGQDVNKGFVYPREQDEPPWCDMRYAPSPDRQHRPQGVGQPLPSDQASRVMHGSDTEVGHAKMSGDAFVTYDVMVSCLKSLLQEAFVNNQQSPVMPNNGSYSSDIVSKGPQSCQSQKCEGSTRRPVVEDHRQVTPTTPGVATQVLGRTPDVSAGVQAACTDQSPMTPRCESAEQRILLTPGFVSSSGPASNRPKKVAKFDGKSNWGDYLVQFNIAAKLNNWDDTQKAMELATSLEGNARGVLADLSANKQLDFEALTNKLTQRYEPEGQLGVYQSQLHSRRRKRNESIPELVQDISRLVRKAYPAADEQTGSYMAVSSFITALANEAQELFVYQKEPKNLDEAGRAALSFETFRAARMKDVPIVRAQQMNDTPDAPPKWAKDWMSRMERQFSNWAQKTSKAQGGIRGSGNPHALANEPSAQAGNSGAKSANGAPPGNQGTKNTACYRCGATGHWVRNCPNKGRGPPLQQTPAGSAQEESSTVGTGQLPTETISNTGQGNER